MNWAQAGGTARQLGSYSLPSPQIILKFQRRYFLTVKEPKNRFQGIVSASLYSLAGQYDNPIPTRFLAPIDSSQMLERHCLQVLSRLIFSLKIGRKWEKTSLDYYSVIFMLWFCYISVLLPIGTGEERSTWYYYLHSRLLEGGGGA
jgi:hypothetical protein